MKIVIPGGTGQVGAILNRVLTDAGHNVVLLTRRPQGTTQVAWDGQTLGPWASVIDGSDIVINLAGRSVSCRYTKTNLTEMMHSRVRSARVLGAGQQVDGRARRACHPLRYRALAEEPSGRPRPPARLRLRVRLYRVAAGRSRSRRPRPQQPTLTLSRHVWRGLFDARTHASSSPEPGYGARMSRTAGRSSDDKVD